jgi:hypothetical protein
MPMPEPELTVTDHGDNVWTVYFNDGKGVLTDTFRSDHRPNPAHRVVVLKKTGERKHELYDLDTGEVIVRQPKDDPD